MLTREAIQAANDRQVDKVMIPEWAPEGSDPQEAYVFVKSLSGTQRDSWEASLEGMKKDTEDVTFRANLVAMAVVDHRGEPIFTSEDVGWLSSKSSKPLSRLFDKIVEISGLKKDLEELAKN